MSRVLLIASAWACVGLCALPAGAQDSAETAPGASDEAATEAREAQAAQTSPSEAEASEATAADEAAPDGDASEGAAAEAADRAPMRRPKVTVVVVGDADEELRAAALEVEAALSAGAEVRLPADLGLRAALRGETSGAEDGIEDVRVERRRLGRGEAQDAPILAQLGIRAGAVAVVVVRASAAGPEALVLDVRTAQFFDGTLTLDADASISTFVARRARSAARGAVASAAPEVAPERAGAEPSGEGPEPATAPEAATAVTPEESGPQDAGQWFEQNWPYFAAGALLAAAIVFVVVTATQDGPPPPMLRFQAGP